MISMTFENEAPQMATQKTADVIEKAGGRRAVTHLRKHWKKPRFNFYSPKKWLL